LKNTLIVTALPFIVISVVVVLTMTFKFDIEVV
jgi:choline-glycine betaine transporter